MVFTTPQNVMKGNYIPLGLRSGPSYSGFESAVNLLPDANGVILGNAYGELGEGVLYSPFNTYNIVPYPSTAGNIVAAAQVVAAGNLTFTQDTFATTKLLDSNGSFYVQFDWPRVPAVVVAGAAMTGPTNVTIFGEDLYGYPLQHRYVVQAQGTYPANLATPAKAMYRITRVYVDNTTGIGGTLAIQTSNIFGMPYVMKENSYAVNFSWAGNSMETQSGTATLVAGTVTVSTPAVRTGSVILTARQGINATALADLGNLYISAVTSRTSFTITSSDAQDESTIGWTIANGGQNLITPADTAVPTVTTGDVRGLISLPETGATWAPVPDGVRRLVFTPYIMGADQFINIMAAGDQPQGTGAVAPATNTVPPLTKADLYGRNQYYTGKL